MSGRRVALVTRRFWPLVGETEMAMADLAVALRRAGQDPTVVTARWNKLWPLEFRYEDVPVVRIAHPAKGLWELWRYMRSVAHWLRTKRSQIDVAVVAGLRHDAMATLGALEKSPVPVILLADEQDALPQHAQRCGRLMRRRCRRADAVAAPDEATREALLACGFAKDRTHVIPPGVPIHRPTSSDARRLARRALAAAMGGAVLSPLTPLAIHLGELQATAELFTLLAAWKQIVAHWPQAQLWLLGEGRERAALFQRIEQLNLIGRVLMPGLPETFDDVLAAADVVVATERQAGSRSVLLAMAAGLPVVASDAPQHRRLVTSNVHGLLFEGGNAEEAATAMARLFKQPTLAAALGGSGRKRCIASFSINRHVEELAELWERLIAAKAARRP